MSNGVSNQKGINFQNKVALFYMLSSIKYSDFLKIKFENESFSDFTLFFYNRHKQSSIFHNFEVKYRTNPLQLNEIRQIIQKESKRIDQYSDQDRFNIVGSSFSHDCKQSIKKGKWMFNFYSKTNKEFRSIKNINQRLCGDHPILKWNREECLFLKYVALIEAPDKYIDNMIIDYFHYRDSFFYTEANLENIISRLYRKITNKSSNSQYLLKEDIEKLLEDFRKEETSKSDTYNLKKDLGKIILNIDEKICTEEGFISLNNSGYITPISQKKRAVLHIINKLETSDFKLKTIEWFIDKILIKEYYLYQGLDIIKKYAQDIDNIDMIMDIIDNLIKRPIDSFYLHRVNNILFEISTALNEQKNNVQKTKEFRSKVLKILDKTIPNWKETNESYDEDYWKYISVPKLICNICQGNEERGIEFIFEKQNFTKMQTYWAPPETMRNANKYFYFIKNFIDKDFKKNFDIVVKKIADQFTFLYANQGSSYEGFEMSGGYFGSNHNYQLKEFEWEKILCFCIETFYEKHSKNWKYIKSSLLDKPINKKYPAFVKRSCIQLLLKNLKNEENSEEYYKSLESILEIKKGFPKTSEVVANVLPSQMSDYYLQKIIKKILYDSKQEIIANPFIVQLVVNLVAQGKKVFEIDLKNILIDKNIKSDSFSYERILEMLSANIGNLNIRNFFNKNKDIIDYNKDRKLSNYVVESNPNIEIERLFKSSKSSDLDQLADIIVKQQFIDTPNREKIIQKMIDLTRQDLNGLYKRAKNSEDMKKAIASFLVEIFIHEDISIAENIINLCIEDIELCGESITLNEQAKNSQSLSAQTMRTKLCYSLDEYITKSVEKDNQKSWLKVKKAFLWTKTLIDLGNSLAKKINEYPCPNYYLRAFASLPLISLSYYMTRKKLNQFHPGLGDEIKECALSLLEHTKKEFIDTDYKPIYLLENIIEIFNLMRDLNEEEAEQVLDFINTFKITKACQLFIYYALFREKTKVFSKKEQKFESQKFKERLKYICQRKPNTIKEQITFIMSREIEQDFNEQTSNQQKIFNEIKDYWNLLFDDVSKNMISYLIKGLSVLLKQNKFYYLEYKEYLFKIIKTILEGIDKFQYVYLDLDGIVPSIVKYDVKDLIQIIQLFLKKGDTEKGLIPFDSEIKKNIIPAIKEAIKQGSLSDKEITKINKELGKYSLSISS